MDRTEVSKTLRTAVFKVVRSAAGPPDMTTFLDMALAELKDLLVQGSPSADPSFWLRTLMETIQKEFNSRGFGVSNLGIDFFDGEGRVVRDLREHIYKNKFLLPEAMAGAPGARAFGGGPRGATKPPRKKPSKGRSPQKAPKAKRAPAKSKTARKRKPRKSSRK